MRNASDKTTRQRGTQPEPGRPRYRGSRRPGGRTPAHQWLSRPSGLAGCLYAAALLAWLAPARAQAPPDAVIELWQQQWTLNNDGSIVYLSLIHI